MNARVKPTESAKSFKKYAGMRTETSQIVCWSISIHMNYSFKFGNDRLTRCHEGMREQQIKYIQDCKRYGNAIALEKIKQRASACGANPELRWPEEPDRPKINSKEWNDYCELMDHRQEVTQLSWCMYAIAIHDACGFGEKRFARLFDLTEERLMQYVDDAATSEFDHSGKRYANKDYAFEKLRIQAEHIFKEGCEIRDESDEEGAKRTAAWIEKTNREAVRGMVAENVTQLKKIVATGGTIANAPPFRTPLLRLLGANK